MQTHLVPMTIYAFSAIIMSTIDIGDCGTEKLRNLHKITLCDHLVREQGFKPNSLFLQPMS